MVRKSKSKRVFLLGAGASKPAKIPLSFELGQILAEHDFAASELTIDQALSCQKAICFIAGGLAFQNASKGISPFKGIDVEALFNAADQLSNRKELELAPFISSWHGGLDALEDPTEENISDYSKRFMEAVFKPIRAACVKGYGDSELSDKLIEEIDEHFYGDKGINFGLTLETAVSVLSGKTRYARLFEMLKEAMIFCLKEQVWLTESEEVSRQLEYLTPLTKYCIDTNSSIVTLNYDNTIELSCRAMTLPQFNGQ